MNGTFTVVIVGMGPRGLSVFERLAARLARQPPAAPVELIVVDRVRPGSGRIWRTGQAPWLTMNTVVGELTMFSGPEDGHGCRAGAGCTFGEWLARHPDPELSGLGPDDYAPRHAYGEYLQHVLARVTAGLAGVARVVPRVDRVTAVHDRGSHYEVEIAGAPAVSADAVVLATGHAANDPSAREARLARLARQHPGLLFVPGDSVSDLRPDDIPAGADVGIIGMGLSFYDLLLSLTVGRGGVFERGPSGRLAYKESGEEPSIVAASRSGVPIRTRGRNQKSGPPSRPHFFSHAVLARRRAEAAARHGTPALDLHRDLGSLLRLEINHVYLVTLARRRNQALARRLGAALLASPPESWPAVAGAHGIDAELLDLRALARPFSDRVFTDVAQFRTALVELLRADLGEAELGNVDGPIKAALDVIRDAREVIRSAVEFGGLTPESHREFQAEFAPDLSLLSTGPPPMRTEQLLTLIDAGLVDVAGPDARVDFDVGTRRFSVESPQVAGSRRDVSVLIDSRVPLPHLRRNSDTLMRQLLRDGVTTEFVNTGPSSRHQTGGLRIGPAENRVVAADGSTHRALYALGVPTENVRWFTQIGNLRPTTQTQFEREADAVALSVLRFIALTTGDA